MNDGWFFVKNNEGQKTMELSSLKIWKKKKQNKKFSKPESTCGESILKNESEIHIYRKMKAEKICC